jgi:ArsR family transcriptional regulator
MSKYRDKDVEEFAEIFKALSNPNRLRIFLRLVSCCAPGTRASIDTNADLGGCACVGELGKKELRRAGLISMERRGQKIECWIDPKTIAALRDFFS